MPTVLIRADASPQIGYGHLMRCLALAEALAAQGRRVRFLSRPDAGARRVLAVAGSPVAWVPARASADTLTRAIEAAVRRSADCAGAARWLVLDSYERAGEQVEAARLAGARTLVIDDAGGFEARAHLVVNYALDATTAWYPAANGARFLLGGAYALIRREFREARRRARPPRARARLLVTLGGSDRRRRVLAVLRGLAALGPAWWRTRELDIALGHGFEDAPEVETLARTLSLPARIHRNVGRMSELMAQADLAIAGSGGTLYELACLGVPTVSLILAENQTRHAAAFFARGCAGSLGRGEEVTPADIARAVDELLRDPAARARMSERGRALIDGRGAERVARAITSDQ